MLSVACTRSPDYSELPPSLEPVSIVREVDGYDFYFPVSVATDSNLVFIADYRDCSIRVFDGELKLLYSIGMKGEGPGEFEHLLDIDANGGLLVAFNLYPSRISVFDYSGLFLTSFPVEASRWGKVSVSNRGSIIFARFLEGSTQFISEYSMEGTLLAEVLEHDAEADWFTSHESKMFIECVGDDVFAFYEQVPRIQGIGNHSFDHEYTFEAIYPMYRKWYKHREKSRKEGRRTYLNMAHFGGFTFAENHIIAGGPHYHLMVLDLETDMLSFIQMGTLAHEFGESERLTSMNRRSSLNASRAGVDVTSVMSYIDGIAINDEIWMISAMNSCLVRYRIADILAAKQNSLVITWNDWSDPN
ncbi:hypothetical protein ACFL6R_06685 [Gemmatimonadota bacterium]